MDYVYIISRKWLTEWKNYTGHDDVLKGFSPSGKFFMKGKPGVINKYIVGDKNEYHNIPD